jgi:hypothetical protein
MEEIMRTILIASIIAFALIVSLLNVGLKMTQAQNASLIENANHTRTILNMKNHIAILVNATTNKTISVTNLTANMPNTTASENLNGVGNITTNETNKMIIPGNTGNITTNETNKMIIPGNTGNIGNDQNLSERLSKLAK